MPLAVLRVTIRAIDRTNHAIAIDFDSEWWPLINWLRNNNSII
jgi:hypothetical protein